MRQRNGQAVAGRYLEVLCASDAEGKSAFVITAFEPRAKDLA